MIEEFDGRNRRRVFRLHLPSDSRLTATIDNQQFEIVEVAEFSLMVLANPLKPSNQTVEGIIRWSNGSETEFKGEVGPSRHQGKALIWKVQGIEMHHVINEQRRILRRFTETEFESDRKAAS